MCSRTYSRGPIAELRGNLPGQLFQGLSFSRHGGIQQLPRLIKQSKIHLFKVSVSVVFSSSRS